MSAQHPKQKEKQKHTRFIAYKAGRAEERYVGAKLKAVALGQNEHRLKFTVTISDVASDGNGYKNSTIKRRERGGTAR